MKTLKNIFTAAALLAAMVSCRKEVAVPAAPASEGDFTECEGMTFKAYASPRTRVHFESSDEGTANEGLLYWDATDKVGIMSVYLNNEGDDFASKIDGYIASAAAEAYFNDKGYSGQPLNKYITSAVAKVVPDDPASSATLYAPLGKEDWFANSDEAEDGKAAYYDFIGIYPMSSAPVFQLVAKDNDDNPIVGVHVNVPNGQWSAQGFGSYQVCMDCGLEDTGSAPYGAYSMGGILDDSESVVFDDFSPLTAMLEFDIKSDTDAPVLLSQIQMYTENYDVTFGGSAFASAEGWNKFIFPDRWESPGGNFMTLNVQDVGRFGHNGYPTITSTSTGDVFRIVVLPSYKAYPGFPSWCASYGGEKLIFEGLDPSGNVVFTATKVIPENGFEPGKRYKFTLDFTTAVKKPLEGQYSVSLTKKVEFSRGNLYYNPEGGWDYEGFYYRRWNFFETQYTRWNWSNTYALPEEYSGFDMFGWATAGTGSADENHVEYQPWSSSSDPYSYGPSLSTLSAGTPWAGQSCEPYCEWGRNSNLEICVGRDWRTLSADEWNYLLNTRSASTVNGVPNARFVKGRIYGYPGIIIFSDSFGDKYAAGQQSQFGSNINDPTAGFDDFDIYPDNDMEIAGYVFLPVCGLREGGNIAETSTLGAYWTSTPYDDCDALGLMFDSSNLSASYRFSRFLGLNVRLVRDYEPPYAPVIPDAPGAGEYNDGGNPFI